MAEKGLLTQPVAVAAWKRTVPCVSETRELGKKTEQAQASWHCATHSTRLPRHAGGTAVVPTPWKRTSDERHGGYVPCPESHSRQAVDRARGHRPRDTMARVSGNVPPVKTSSLYESPPHPRAAMGSWGTRHLGGACGKGVGTSSKEWRWPWCPPVQHSPSREALAPGPEPATSPFRSDPNWPAQAALWHGWFWKQHGDGEGHPAGPGL